MEVKLKPHCGEIEKVVIAIHPNGQVNKNVGYINRAEGTWGLIPQHMLTDQQVDELDAILELECEQYAQSAADSGSE